MTTERRDNACCSFCGQPEAGDRRLVLGPEVSICEDCVCICNEFFADEETISTENRGSTRIEVRDGQQTIIYSGPYRPLP